VKLRILRRLAGADAQRLQSPKGNCRFRHQQTLKTGMECQWNTAA
jgi:hypothetical protein